MPLLITSPPSRAVIHTSDLLGGGTADLSIGSTTMGPDCTAALQAILDTAQTSPLHVVWDGKYSCTGLVVYSNTTIEFIAGCGVILRPNSNRTLISNAHNVKGAGGSAWSNGAVDQNIKLFGPGIINGNIGLNLTAVDDANARQVLSVSTGTTNQQWIVCALRFWGVNNLWLDGLTVLNAWFNISIGNCKNIWITDLVSDCGIQNSSLQGQDALQVQGCTQFLYADNLLLRSADDALALNADDNNSIPPYTVPNPGYGPITDVHINNVTFLSGQQFGLTIQCNTSSIDRIRISGVKGYSTGYFCCIRNYKTGSPSGTGNVGSVTIENTDVRVSSGGSSPIQADILVSGTINNLRLSNITHYNYDNTNSVMFMGDTGIADLAVIKNLEIDGLRIYDGTPQGATNYINATHAYVDRMTIRNVSLYRPPTAAVIASPLLHLYSSDVTYYPFIRELILDGIQWDRSSVLVDNQNFEIGFIQAHNVRHTRSNAGATFQFSQTGAVQRMTISNVDTQTLYSGTVPTLINGDYNSNTALPTKGSIVYKATFAVANTALSSYTPPDTGTATWLNTQGSLRIVSNKISTVGATGGVSNKWISYLSLSQSATYITVSGTVNSSTVGIIVRGVDASNALMFQVIGGGVCRWWRLLSGALVAFGDTGPTIPAATSTNFTVAIGTKGSYTTAYLTIDTSTYVIETGLVDASLIAATKVGLLLDDSGVPGSCTVSSVEVANYA